MNRDHAKKSACYKDSKFKADDLIVYFFWNRQLGAAIAIRRFFRMRKIAPTGFTVRLFRNQPLPSAKAPQCALLTVTVNEASDTGVAEPAASLPAAPASGKIHI